MARAQIYGHATLRPVRVGVVGPFDTQQDLQRLACLASTRWGGSNYVALPSSLALNSVADALDLDVLAALPGSADGYDPPPALKYRSFLDLGPFDRSDDTLNSQVLDMAQVLPTGRWAGLTEVFEPASVHWHTEHPLSLVLSVLYGHFPQEDDDVEFWRLWRATATTKYELGSDSPVPAGVAALGPLQQTRRALRVIPRPPTRGIVCVAADSLSDLIGFWNLRATGADVAMWPLGHEDLMLEYFEHWWGSRPEQTDTGLYVWSRSQGLPDRLRQTLATRSERVIQLPLTPLPRWVHSLPAASVFSTSFSVDFESDSWSVDVPLPRMDFLAPSSWYSNLGTIAVDVEVSSQTNVPAAKGFAVPLSRELAVDVLRMFGTGLAPFCRPHGSGIVSATDAASDRLTLPLIASFDIVRQIFLAADLEVTRSDSGLYVERLIEMLGGVSEDSAANQPAIHSVLAKASRAPYGQPPKALVAEAKLRQGSWHEQWFMRNRAYPEWVVQWLCDKGLLRALLKSKCPRCRNTLSVDADSLSSSLECPLCGEARPLALHLMTLHPEWRLALHRHIRADRMAETLPIMAALSLLSGLHRDAEAPAHHVVGLSIKGRDNLKCEIDLAVAMVERGRPLVVIGECKSYRDSINVQDVDNLVGVQGKLMDAGIECYVLFASLRERLDESEVHAVRAATEGIESTTRFRPDGPIEPILPVVLDAGSLTEHSWSESSLKRGLTAGRSLAALSEASCRRSLGLSSLELQATETGPGWSALWQPLANHG